MERDRHAVEAEIVPLRSAWTDAIRDRDKAALDRLMADEFVFIDERGRWGKARFIANVHRWDLVGMTFDEVLVHDYGVVVAMHARVALHALLADGDTVAAHWTLVGTQQRPWGSVRATGRRIQVMGMNMFRLADGQIVEGWGAWDTATILRQLGVLPSPSAAAASPAARGEDKAASAIRGDA